MPEARLHFHESMRKLEDEVLRMGVAAAAQLERALKALASGDGASCDAVVASDDEIDALYLDVEHRILDLFALQTPVASDLRLLTSLLHINLHLERIADMGVNIAKITKLTAGLPRNPTVLAHLEEMGGIALRMVAASMDAFARRDLELCRKLPGMDDPLDRLNRGMLEAVLETSGDRRSLEWGIRMHVISRQIERVGDHAVDVGEQIAFLITGMFEEFTDASHPEIEHPAGA
ncbi:MAG: phosphate signaling complex protein PhoU [Acidobacteria bacterium]|nr:phosphate signaling complex protein PhoU [Acidobacteriota bacterium]